MDNSCGQTLSTSTTLILHALERTAACIGIAHKLCTAGEANIAVKRLYDEPNQTQMMIRVHSRCLISTVVCVNVLVGVLDVFSSLDWKEEVETLT